MKNLLPLALICTALLFNACKDDDDDPFFPPPEQEETFETNSYSLLSPGNYWIYEVYTENNDGQLELSSNVDSSYIEKDSLINGETFFKFVDQNLGMINIQFLRDSADYIIDEKGELIFALTNFGPLLSESGDDIVEFKTYMVGPRPVTTTLGDFDALKKETEISVNGESSLDRCGLNTFWFYVKDVGVVRNEILYFSNCQRVRRELVRYSIL